MATQELDAAAAKAEMKDEGKKKPRPNNPEEASEFMEQINEAVDKFAKTIHQYEPYSIQDVYSDFMGRYYKLLSKIEDYFVDASPTAVLELEKWNVREKSGNCAKTPELVQTILSAPQGNEKVRGYAQFQKI